MGLTNDFFDKSAIESLTADCGAEVVQALISLYETEAPALLTRIALALESSSAGELEISSHSLKSSSAALGAVQIARICAEIEHKSNQKDLSGCKELVTEVEKELERFVQFLKG